MGRNLARSDLTYRNLANAEIDDDGQQQADTRIDKITDKVIQFMDATDPGDWSKEQWQLFKQIWQEQKIKRTPQQTLTKTSDMTTAELLKRMNSGAASNS